MDALQFKVILWEWYLLKLVSNRKRCLEKSSMILLAFAMYVPRTLSQLTAFKDNITYSKLSLLGVYF
jgi:hypothetical protein